jgi:SpoVK/Ycf46/Vps4 family AAA+-type ATPase
LKETGLFVREPLDLATRFSVGPGVMKRVSREVAHTLAYREPEAPDEASGEPLDAGRELDAALRQHIATRLGATATRVDRLATWSRVILPPDIQESIVNFIGRIRQRRRVYDEWRYADVLTTARGIVALFQGGPGTGKTLVAGAIASELGFELYRVDVSRITSKWIGETEQNLARLFDAAEDGHAILLFDEADTLFAKRTQVQSSVDRFANSETNYLLQRLDSFEGIAILTTNFGTAIDSAFKRRLTMQLTFPFPDEHERDKLWRAHLPDHVPGARTIDTAALARRYQLSGGYIRNAALRAAFSAAEQGTPLNQDIVERAIQAEYREMGKLSDSSVLE